LTKQKQNKKKKFGRFVYYGKYKEKLIILDNASSHRNQSVKDLINKDNKILYSVPYQHYTNSIENFFSILKSKLRKTKSLGYDKLQKNIKEVLK
jgi:transposase